MAWDRVRAGALCHPRKVHHPGSVLLSLSFMAAQARSPGVHPGVLLLRALGSGKIVLQEWKGEQELKCYPKAPE